MISNISVIFDDIICQLSHWKNKQQFDALRNRKDKYSLGGFDQLKCIYIHIPKAAGISINKALFGNYGGGHSTVRLYKRVFGPKRYSQYYKFTFVRNPYSRLLSAYRFLKAGGFDEKDRLWANKNLYDFDSFDEFVKNWINEESIWTYSHFKPQYSFVCDVGLQPEIDFIGKVETIDEDFDEVCRTLGIKNNLAVHNKSKTDNSKWTKFCSDYSMEKISRIYGKDFRIFNYCR